MVTEDDVRRIICEELAERDRADEAAFMAALHGAHDGRGDVAVRIRKMDGAAAQVYLDAIDLSKCRCEDGSTDPQ